MDMTADISTYRYGTTWPFLLASIGLCFMAVWTFKLDGLPAALFLVSAAALVFVGYIDWRIFSISIDANAILFNSLLQKRLVPIAEIASVEHIFGKSSDFIVLRPKHGASLTIWNYLVDFDRFKSLVSDAAQRAGIEIRVRDKWGKWKTVSSLS